MARRQSPWRGTTAALRPSIRAGFLTSPTLAMMGERGPEAVIPLDRLPSIMAGISERGGRGASPIIVQGSLIDTEGLIQATGAGELQLARRGRQRVFR